MSGLKTDIGAINGVTTWLVLILVIIIGFAGKVVGTLLASMLYQMPLLEGITLGFLMNSKGLVEMIVLNVGRDQKVPTFKNFSFQSCNVSSSNVYVESTRD